MLPLASEDLEWAIKKKYSITYRLVQVVAQMMNAYQQHHFDMGAVFSFSEREWELWCQQCACTKEILIGKCFSVVPAADVRYEKVCAYLEALTKIEVQETLAKSDAKAWVTLSPPTNCTFCSFQYQTYDNRNVPFCPRLSFFGPRMGTNRDKRGQTGTKQDISGQIGKRPHLASTPI